MSYKFPPSGRNDNRHQSRKGRGNEGGSAAFNPSPFLSPTQIPSLYGVTHKEQSDLSVVPPHPGSEANLGEHCNFEEQGGIS